MVKLSLTESRKILVAFIASFVIAGSFDGMTHGLGDLPKVMHMFAISFLLFWWVREHADEHNIRPPWGAKFLSGLIYLVGIPYYFYAGFGFKKGTVKLLLGLIIWFVSALLYSVVSTL